jgi:hypothetical protein
MLQLYYRLVDATSGGRVYHARWMSRLGIPPVPLWTVLWALKLSAKAKSIKQERSI